MVGKGRADLRYFIVSSTPPTPMSLKRWVQLDDWSIQSLNNPISQRLRRTVDFNRNINLLHSAIHLPIWDWVGPRQTMPRCPAGLWSHDVDHVMTPITYLGTSKVT